MDLRIRGKRTWVNHTFGFADPKISEYNLQTFWWTHTTAGPAHLLNVAGKGAEYKPNIISLEFSPCTEN